MKQYTKFLFAACLAIISSFMFATAQAQTTPPVPCHSIYGDPKVLTCPPEYNQKCNTGSNFIICCPECTISLPKDK